MHMQIKYLNSLFNRYECGEQIMVDTFIHNGDHETNLVFCASKCCY